MHKLKLFTAVLCLTTIVKMGAQTPARKPVYFSAGVSFNPGLALIHRETEFGPAISVSTPIWKQWDLGAAAYVRSVWHRAPDHQHGYKRHISFPYDKESVYALQLGYTTKHLKWKHGFHLLPGLRLERYQEKLYRPDLEINETYQLKENNLFIAASYSIRRQMAQDQYLGIRLMLPFDGLPQDDVNRYSLELNWIFVLRP